MQNEIFYYSPPTVRNKVYNCNGFTWVFTFHVRYLPLTTFCLQCETRSLIVRFYRVSTFHANAVYHSLFTVRNKIYHLPFHMSFQLSVRSEIQLFLKIEDIVYTNNGWIFDSYPIVMNFDRNILNYVVWMSLNWFPLIKKLNTKNVKINIK